jgi:hypothetical protein
MRVEELAKKLNEAAEKMKNDNSTYHVDELLEPGHGEGNYKFTFRAKKKGGFGLLKTVASVARVAKGAMYGGIEGALWRAAYEVERRTYRATFEPIKKDMKGKEIAALLKRWSDTIPQGYIETIGSTINLPENPDFISAKISVGKEISIIIDFARLRSMEPVSEVPKVPEAKPPQPTIPQMMSVPPVIIPETVRTMMPAIISRIYVPGTLKNVKNGFELTFHNNVGDVVLIAPIELKVDGILMDVNATYINIGGKEVKSSDISFSNPLTFKENDKMTIMVSGTKLPSGIHRIDVRTNIQGVGELSFTFQDNVT